MRTIALEDAQTEFIDASTSAVPFEKTGETREHFPRLHDYRIEDGVLFNTTVDGEQEQFTDLIFHGGDGETLQMRMFSEPDLLRRLAQRLAQIGLIIAGLLVAVAIVSGILAVGLPWFVQALSHVGECSFWQCDPPHVRP